MKIHIPHTNYTVRDQRELFILTRPFFRAGEWLDSDEEKEKWGLDARYRLVTTIAEADVVLLPFSINFYFAHGKKNDLIALQHACFENNLKAYGYIGGDFGLAFPEFSNIVYFRMGGFKSQLSQNNQGFPVALSDHFQRIFNRETITPTTKRDFAVVGFCGHATTATFKRLKEVVKCLKENVRRFFQKPWRNDWEPLFASAYERAKVLHFFEKSTLIQTNFIYRKHYRGGAQTDSQREQTTLEYYNNIASSDYVVCVRGAGNFSVRFYETLMMGKIPIFVNTDCLLPFENQINWKQHVVWIEWKDRKNIAQMVFDFHKQLSNEDFIQMQLNNRKLWKETLSVKGMLEMITNDI